MLYLQSAENKNANAMKLESLKRQLAYFEESNVARSQEAYHRQTYTSISLHGSGKTKYQTYL